MRLILSSGVPVASVLAAALAVGGGCREAHEAPFGKSAIGTPAAARTTETPAAPSPVPSPSGLTGIWTVVGHHLPGISAMSSADAAAWHGRTVRLTSTQATSPSGNHCDQPAYAHRTVARDSFLAAEFGLPPGSLTPLASRDRITVLEVSCGEARWAAFGGRVIEIDPDHALSPWDGVFFELARARDFRASGTEPFWRIEILKGKEIRFTEVGRRDAVTPVPAAQVVPQTGATVYHAVTEAHDLRIVIDRTPCVDNMSGKRFDRTVSVTHNGQTYHGCGGDPP